LKRYLPSYETCFACGKKNPIGLKLCLYVENGRVVSEFIPREDLCGFSGILHGGIISSIIDEALWWASAVGSGRLVVTKDLKLSYLRPVTIRKRYRVEAGAAQPEGGAYRCTGRIVDRDGSVYVEGEGTYVPLRKGKKRDPRDMLSYVDEKGDPLPDERIYRFGMPEGEDTPQQ
jgi:acyl-coenzyme A thioesterase PaaI-like protein